MARSWRLSRGLVALTMLLAACGDDGGGETSPVATSDQGAVSTTSGAVSTTADDEEPGQAQGCTGDRVGGELTVAQGGDLKGFDPTVVTGASRLSGGAEMTAVYDTLMRSTVEAGQTTGGVEPHVAESLEPNDELTEWTLTLREGVEFGNGDPLTADAVVASIERFEGSDVAAASFAGFISAMEVVDDRTVVFELDDPWGSFPYFLASAGGMIVNTAVVDEMGAEEFNLDPPAGAGVGPYELVRYAPGEEVVMRAKDNYWGGPVCIESLRFTYLADPEARYEALKLGESDVTVLDEAAVVHQARDVDNRPGTTSSDEGGAVHDQCSFRSSG